MTRLLCIVVFVFAQAIPASAFAAPKEGRLSDGVVVIGTVQTPQVIRHTGELTISGALAIVGGTGDFGSDWIYVIRNGELKFKTSGRRIRKDPTKEDLKLLPWDIVCAGSPPLR